MRALITAGGHGTRLRPITHTTNKHVISLANKPLIFYALEKIAECGIKEVGININPGEKELQKVVGNGRRWGVNITYIEQTGGPKGLAHILKVAEPFLAGRAFVFYLGDNIILGSIKKFIRRFKREKMDSLLALSEVKDPQYFGVPQIRGGKIVKIDEKPVRPKSRYAVTGIYIYRPEVYESVNAIEPSARGELEISDVHSHMIKNGRRVSYEIITGWWKDTGKPEDLLEGNSLLLQEMKEDRKGKIGSEVILQGKVSIGRGARILGRSLIRGPVSVGKGAVLQNAHIGPYTSIGNDTEIKGSEIEHSIIFDNAKVSGKMRIVDSLVGKNAIISPKEESLPSGHKLLVGENSTIEL